MVLAALEVKLGLCQIPSLPLAPRQQLPTPVLPCLHHHLPTSLAQLRGLELGSTRQLPEFAQPLQI
jgi:hypothetical protein